MYRVNQKKEPCGGVFQKIQLILNMLQDRHLSKSDEKCLRKMILKMVTLFKNGTNLMP